MKIPCATTVYLDQWEKLELEGQPDKFAEIQKASLGNGLTVSIVKNLDSDDFYLLITGNDKSIGYEFYDGISIAEVLKEGYEDIVEREELHKLKDCCLKKVLDADYI